MVADASGSVSYGELIRRNRNFRFFWGGQIVSQLGDWFSLITLNTLLLKLTGRVDSLALLAVAGLLPGLLWGPVAGLVADRVSRVRTMIGADLLRALLALGFLLIHDAGTAWIGFACMAGMASLTSFFEPARVATLPNICSRDELVTANALTSVTWSLLFTSGALVGGIVGHFLGPSVAFLMNSLSFLLSAALLSRLRMAPGADGPRPGKSEGHLAMIGSGIAYMRRRPAVLAGLSAKLGWGLNYGVHILLPVYGSRVFPLSGDADHQLATSFLFAVAGVGTAIGPIVARRFTGGDLPRIRWAIAVSFVLGGVWHAAMTAAPNIWLAGLFLALGRFHGAIIWVFSTLMLQVLVDDEYRGRVFAAETSLFTGTMMLSSLGTSRSLDAGIATPGQAGLVMAMGMLLVGVGWLIALYRGLSAPPPPAESNTA